jgi:rubrerythrin
MHREIFKNIYNTIKNKKGWPDVKFSGDGGKDLRTIFAKALDVMDNSVNSMPAELDAIKTAMVMENKTYDYYNGRYTQADNDAEKQLYESLVSQESEHYRVLLDYYEFLKDPASWFVKTEHTSVDG